MPPIATVMVTAMVFITALTQPDKLVETKIMFIYLIGIIASVGVDIVAAINKIKRV